MNYLLFLVTCFAAVLVVVILQWHDTGEWFVFSKAHLAWNKKFQLPALPIQTWNNFKILFMDTSAMIIGLLCGFILLGFLLNKLQKQIIAHHNELNFSLAYLCFVTIVSLLFGVQGENTTYINSLNRYIFGTGFFLTFMIHHLRSKQFSYKNLVFVLLVVIMGLGLTGYFSNPYDAEQIISARLDAMGILICFGLYYYLSKVGSNTFFFLVVYLFQSTLQLHFFELYLKKNWVG